VQREAPEDVVIGTGEDHAVADFVEVAFGYVGLRQERRVRTDPKHFRAADSWVLRADGSRADRLLGWKPRLSFEALVKLLVDADLQAAGLDVIGEGVEAARRAGLAWSLAGLFGPLTVDEVAAGTAQGKAGDGR